MVEHQEFVKMRSYKEMLVLALMAGLTNPAVAHEFWISPEEGHVAPGTSVSAQIRVGQDFSGLAYP